ncbi:antitoxin [soil metagenome]
MRTTLTIPDDVLAAARQRAEAQGVTVGEALGEIARRGLETELEECEDGFWKSVKFFPRRPGDPRITLELVNRLRDETI